MVQSLPLFGSPLVTALARSSIKTTNGLCVPGILARCYDEIYANGMELEGIFRKSGSAAVMNQLQARFEAAEDPLTVTFPPNVNGHSIAGLLKRYLQQLPEPVIPKQNQRQFIEAFDDIKYSDDTIKARLLEACKALPYEHLHLLQFILYMCTMTQRCEKTNHMSLNSLAIIFAPTCVRLDGVSQLMPNEAIDHVTEFSKAGSSSCSDLPVSMNKQHDIFAKARKFICDAFKRKIGKHQKNNWNYNGKNSQSMVLYQPSELLRLDLIKESTTWIKIFKFMMVHASSFTRITRYNSGALPPRIITRVKY
ncbi:Rho GTPase activating protein 24 [Rhizopus azygosporus]|uniref:Rho GTPase activating protein 24 n=1 Tax=Rhizopus azygosporus TaxID=86630 RepID=A0A367KAI5_RHIAZ|nr:Rho GTPase activating protein 24 [Rhizopus azygosporus]